MRSKRQKSWCESDEVVERGEWTRLSMGMLVKGNSGDEDLMGELRGGARRVCGQTDIKL